MTSKTRYAAKFGNAAPIPVEKATYHGATVTKAVDEIRSRIDAAIEQLEPIKSVRKARAADFSTLIVSKKQRNLFVKVGYGRNNELFSEILQGFFDCPVAAKTALIEAREMLSQGEFDSEIAALIEKKRLIAARARATVRKIVTEPVKKITHFKVINAQDVTRVGAEYDVAIAGIAAE